MKFSLVFLILGLISSASSLPRNTKSPPTFEFSVANVHSLLRSKQWTCVNVLVYFMQRATTYDPTIRSIISYNPVAFKRAKELDTYYNTNNEFMGSLHCIPVIVKDNIDIAGMPTTGGIYALRNSIPLKNALVIDRMEKAGALILAKANLAQLAIGAIYESEQVGLCQNPYNYNRTCSGSSSGSGASIASGFAVISLGTDTGGSILGPGNNQGLFSLRPPYDAATTNGVIPVVELQDSVGPMTKYLRDLVLAHSILRNDRTIYTNVFDRVVEPKSLKVKVITQFMKSTVTDDIVLEYDEIILPIIKGSLERLRRTNVEIAEVTLTNDQLVEFKKIYDETILAETALIHCLPQFYDTYFEDTSRFGPDAPVKNWTEFSESPLISEFWRSQLVNIVPSYCASLLPSYRESRRKFLQFVDDNVLTDDVDALFLPSNPSAAQYHDKRGNNNTITLIHLAVYSASGFLTMPSGFTSKTVEDPDGLPFTMGLIAKGDKMEKAFKVARLYEEVESFVKLPYTVPLLDNSAVEMFTCAAGVVVSSSACNGTGFSWVYPVSGSGASYCWTSAQSAQTYTNAQAYCNSIGGRLPTLTTSARMNDYYQYIPSSYCWAGLILLNGNWVWEDGSNTPLNTTIYAITFWNSGEPSTGPYAAMNGNYAGSFAAETSTASLEFVCEQCA